MEPQKPSTERTYSTASTISLPASHNSDSKSSTSKSTHKSLLSAMKKPFQGWSLELMAAKDDLDDDYNFPVVGRGWFEEGESQPVKKA